MIYLIKKNKIDWKTKWKNNKINLKIVINKIMKNVKMNEILKILYIWKLKKIKFFNK